MSIKKIKKHNTQQFLDDLKSANKVMVLPTKTRTILCVRKLEVLREAEVTRIFYHMDDTIFRIKQNVMIIE